jgi:hypothetical protein
MALHIRRLAVGTESIENLAAFQARRLAGEKQAGRDKLYTYTRMVPRRAKELVDGGSLYWVIKGYIRVRQEILGVIEGHDEEGRRMCKLHLSPELVPTELMPQKAFQGWRYFKTEDAPADLKKGSKTDAALPDDMATELRELGLL